MTTNPFFLKAEHCIGKVADAPASADSKVCSCYCNVPSAPVLEMVVFEVYGCEPSGVRPGSASGGAWCGVFLSHLSVVRHLDKSSWVLWMAGYTGGVDEEDDEQRPNRMKGAVRLRINDGGVNSR